MNQEWEAYVSDSDSDGEGRGSWSDMFSPEERERQRREREESRRVLSELKAVLGFRASEGERMKRKQLLFNDQGLHSPISSLSCHNSSYFWNEAFLFFCLHSKYKPKNKLNENVLSKQPC